MGADTIVPLLSRWVHILSVITLIGGTIFIRLVLMPAAKATLTEQQHDTLREAIRARWAIVTHAGIALLLFSGTYNAYLGFTAHPDQPLYHGLFGIKILLAFTVFFFVSALVGRSETMAGIRKNRARWMSVTVAAAIAIVIISGILRSLPPTPVQTL